MPAPTALTGREVWFLTGSQRLYGEETLRQVAAQSQAIAGVLACSSSTRRRPRGRSRTNSVGMPPTTAWRAGSDGPGAREDCLIIHPT